MVIFTTTTRVPGMKSSNALPCCAWPPTCGCCGCLKGRQDAAPEAYGISVDLYIYPFGVRISLLFIHYHVRGNSRSLSGSLVARPRIVGLTWNWLCLALVEFTYDIISHKNQLSTWVSIYHSHGYGHGKPFQNGPLNPPTYAAHDGAYGPRNPKVWMDGFDLTSLSIGII